MTSGRSRKKKAQFKESSDENDHSQTGQGEEDAQVPEEKDQKS
jgi:hypothetical protein